MEESPANSGTYQAAALAVGASALFLAVATILGYLYTRAYLGELGVPLDTVNYSPADYALQNLALVVVVTGVASVALVRVGFHLGGRPFPTRDKQIGKIVVFVFVLLMATLSVGIGRTLFHGDGLEIALAVYTASFTSAAGLLIVAVHPPRMNTNMLMIVGFGFMLLVWPVGLVAMEAQRTIETGYNTQRATIEITDSSTRAKESFDRDVLLISNGNLFYFDHGNRHAGLRMVPMSSIAKIEYVR